MIPGGGALRCPYSPGKAAAAWSRPGPRWMKIAVFVLFTKYVEGLFLGEVQGRLDEVFISGQAEGPP